MTITPGGLRKFLFRLLIINAVYFTVKWTMDHDDTQNFLNATSLFYYFSAFTLFMLTWETNDWLIRKQVKFHPGEGLDLKNSIRILVINLLIVLPAAAFIYYIGIFMLDDYFQTRLDDKWLQFRIDFFRAALLGFAVIVFNLFYHSVRQKKALQQKMQDLQKEVVTSKYKSLKSQISPHFLFNSLNTLTSLMYEDRDLASDFVTRLASSYRYILDNREEDLVSLEKEMNFLDSFIFMMNVRHEQAIRIKTDIHHDALKSLIPTLSLQMLVENALKHNYYSKERPLEIEIFTAGTIGIVVRNNLQKRDLNEDSTKLGLQNIRKRYSFYTNQEVTVDEDDQFFTVTMPLLRSGARELNLSIS